jgi:transcriptional regulator with XRE-family HTH domain
MIIGHRLRALRENKNLTQWDVAKRTGLLGNYISRAENGHSIPTLETLEKIARALLNAIAFASDIDLLP